MKFQDLWKTDFCESICQGCFHWSRTKVRGSNTIRYRSSLNCKLCRLGFCGLKGVYGDRERNRKFLGSGESMVARLKFKGIDGRAHQKWSLRLNLTQHGETYQVKTWVGLTDWELFLDSMGGGAWPFLVGGVIRLLNCDNERDLLRYLVGCKEQSLDWENILTIDVLLRWSRGKVKAITGLWCPLMSWAARALHW